MGRLVILSPASGAVLSSPLGIARIRYEDIDAASVVLHVGGVAHVIELPGEGIRSGEVRENITLLEGANTLRVEAGAVSDTATVTVPPSGGITLRNPTGQAPVATRAAELQGSWESMSCPAGVISVNGFLQQFAVTAAAGNFDERIVLRPGPNHLAVQIGERYVTRLVQGSFPPAKFLATLVWDTNTTDIDMYVTEPDGSTVWFREKESRGTLDVDRTQGYGPENYSITAQDAQPGRYRVRVHYYADRSLGRSEWTVRVLTDEGLPSQKRRTFYGILDRSMGNSGPQGQGPDWDEVCAVELDSDGTVRFAQAAPQGGSHG